MPTEIEVRIVPAILNIVLYGDDLPWALQLRVAALGDLTGATFTAAFQPNSGTLTTLVVVTTLVGLADSQFSIGYASTVPGKYDVAITQPSGARTYIKGTIKVQENFA